LGAIARKAPAVAPPLEIGGKWRGREGREEGKRKVRKGKG